MTYYILYSLYNSNTYSYFVADSEDNITYGATCAEQAIKNYNSPDGVVPASSVGLIKQPGTDNEFYVCDNGRTIYLITEVYNLYHVRDTHPELFL